MYDDKGSSGNRYGSGEIPMEGDIVRCMINVGYAHAVSEGDEGVVSMERPSHIRFAGKLMFRSRFQLIRRADGTKSEKLCTKFRVRRDE